MERLVSVVIPMFNEAENAAETIREVEKALAAEGWACELIPVSDGSTDTTAAILSAAAAADSHVRPVVYSTNRGRGYALRRGFAHARGCYVSSLDADLSYSPDHVVRMVRMLIEDPEIDIVLASPYMPGGSTDGVPLARLAISRIGNAVLQRALRQPIRTSTGIVRAYRAEALSALGLQSEGKEIHLEILSQAMALGLRIVEMPATLRSRKRGHSKFRPRTTVLSHLSFSLLERPTSLFAVVGLGLLLLAFTLGVYLFSVYASGRLNPERPLMTLMVLLFLGGAVGLSFALLATQLMSIRRGMVRLQAEVLGLRTELRARGGVDADDFKPNEGEAAARRA